MTSGVGGAEAEAKAAGNSLGLQNRHPPERSPVCPRPSSASPPFHLGGFALPRPRAAILPLSSRGLTHPHFNDKKCQRDFFPLRRLTD